jgi:hypothetical protein
MGRWSPAAVVAITLAAASPAAAELQSSAPWLALPRPAETGKPPIYDPQLAEQPGNDRFPGCSPGLPCRLRLLGVIRNNGAVELRATAFTW